MKVQIYILMSSKSALSYLFSHTPTTYFPNAPVWIPLNRLQLFSYMQSIIKKTKNKNKTQKNPQKKGGKKCY